MTGPVDYASQLEVEDQRRAAKGRRQSAARWFLLGLFLFFVPFLALKFFSGMAVDGGGSVQERAEDAAAAHALILAVGYAQMAGVVLALFGAFRWITAGKARRR